MAARRSNDYRTAVWELLKDGKWHSGLKLVEVGGMRAGARVHELRRGEGGGPTRRILCRVVDSCSEYRYVCDCGPLPDEPGPEVPFCPLCRAALAEAAGQVAGPKAPEPANTSTEAHQAPGPVKQLGLFKGAA